MGKNEPLSSLGHAGNLGDSQLQKAVAFGLPIQYGQAPPLLNVKQ